MIRYYKKNDPNFVETANGQVTLE